MTVGELRTILDKFDADAEIVVIARTDLEGGVRCTIDDEDEIYRDDSGDIIIGTDETANY
jgi:hypothetical protein